jgi:subtilase family serine protease
MIRKTITAFITGLVAMALIPALGAPPQQLSGHVPAAVATFRLTPIDRLPAASHLRLGIMLPPRNQEAIAKLAAEIPNPASTNYHHYLTPPEYNERFAPAEEDYQAVVRFAQTNGLTITGMFPGRTIVEVDATVADIERTFHTTMRIYRHPTEPRTFFAPEVEPSLDLTVPIVAISGLNNYLLPGTRSHAHDSPQPISASIGSAAGGFKAGNGNGSSIPGTGSYTNFAGTTWGDLFMGNDFRHAFAAGTALTGSGQVAGVLEWDSFTPADIKTYEKTAGLPNIPIQEVPVAGIASNLDNGDLEVPLDIDMIISMAPGLQKLVVFHGNNFDSMLTEAADPTNGEPMPRVISCSLASGVDGNTSNCFNRFVLQGQSFLYASGDSGALPVEPNGPNGSYTNGAYPSDLEPYMTQVGGTELSMNGLGESWANETVWGDSGSNGSGGPSGSSGGIQTPIPIPEYQQPVNMSSVGGSTIHRNVPDVAMPADNILVFLTNTNGSQAAENADGTSCAAPLWAGYITLANEQAQSQGQPFVGFANPTLYEIAEGPLYASCFHDVISGDNTWSGSPNEYYAAPGYDLCTGWGSARGVNLINALDGFSGPIYVDFNYTGSFQNGTVNYPYKTLAQGTNAVSPGGTIFIITGGASGATPILSKPMTITAQDGAATIIN